MLEKPQLPRHKIKRLGNDIQIVLPSKKNIFRVIWYVLGLIMWGYMTGAFIYVLIVITKITIWAGGITSAFNVFSIFIALLLILLLSFGGVIISSLFRQIFGKEVIKVNSSVMSISRQIFGLERISKYSSYSLEDVSNLHVSTSQNKQISPFAPRESIKTFLESINALLGKNGIIAFEHEKRTFRFGLEIDEAEAKQIILAIEESLPQ